MNATVIPLKDKVRSSDRWRLRRYGLLSAMVAAVTFSCSESREVKVQRFLMRGNDMVENRNFDEAERFFREAIRLDSCFADAWNNLGTLQFNRGADEAAYASYSRALECKPDFIESRLNRANAAYRLREWYTALSDLDRIDEVRPDTVPLLHLRGLIYTGMRDYHKALRAYKDLLSRNPHDFDAMVNLGAVLYAMDRLDTAETVILGAIQAGAEEPNSYNTLALIETGRGDYAKALEWIGRALELRPGDPYFLNNRGYLYLMTDRLPEALEDINGSLVADPSNPWAHRNKGIYYNITGDDDNAIRLLEQALSMDPDLPRAQHYLDMSRQRKGERKTAAGSADDGGISS